MSRGAQLVASLFLAVFGVALAGIALEVGVRALHLVPSRFWQYDELLGTRLIPGKVGWWTQEEHEFRVPVRINQLGFHDRERTYEKPAGTKRVLLIGDSHVEALQVPLADSVGSQLEKQLREERDDVEVVSAGVSGYGTAGELLFFRERGWKFDPDLVLLAFYPGNDVKNNGPELEKALKPVYDEDGELTRIDAGKPRAGGRSLLSRSAAYTFLRKLILTRQPAIARMLVRMGLMKPSAIRPADAPEGVPLDYWVYADPPPPAWVDAWQRTERLLDELREATSERRARFALMIVTSRDHLYPESWEALQKSYPRLAQGRWDQEGPTRRILEWCRSRAVPCLNLLPIFQVERDSGGPRLHFVHDGHWTPAGHALAAQSAAAFILDESLL